MANVQVGSCPRCGAPIYSESPWFSVTPPPAIKTCMCFPDPKIVTTNSTNSEGNYAPEPPPKWTNPGGSLKR